MENNIVFKAGDSLKVEKLDQEVGSEINIDEVFVSRWQRKHSSETPMVENASVTVVISKQARRPKIIVLKKKKKTRLQEATRPQAGFY